MPEEVKAQESETTEEIAISAATKAMLEDISIKAQQCYEELNAKNVTKQQIEQRLQAIQLEIHGYSSTANYLLGREAAEHGSSTFTFDKAKFVIRIPKKASNNGGEKST